MFVLILRGLLAALTRFIRRSADWRPVRYATAETVEGAAVYRTFVWFAVQLPFDLIRKCVVSKQQSQFFVRRKKRKHNIFLKNENKN